MYVLWWWPKHYLFKNVHYNNIAYCKLGALFYNFVIKIKQMSQPSTTLNRVTLCEEFIPTPNFPRCDDLDTLPSSLCCKTLHYEDVYLLLHLQFWHFLKNYYLAHFDTFGENFDFDTFNNDTFENYTFESVWVDVQGQCFKICVRSIQIQVVHITTRQL